MSDRETDICQPNPDLSQQMNATEISGEMSDILLQQQNELAKK